MPPIPKDKLLLIIGAMKSGTSTLFELLSQHPSICPSKIKEPEYFSRNQSHRAPLDRYEDLWDFKPEIHRYCMEGSTGYTKFPEEKDVPDRIREEGYHPYLIYIVRDPAGRVQSEFNYIRFHPFLKGPADPLDEFYVSKSRYFLQLEKFLRVFPDKKRYLVIRMEDLSAHPGKTLENVFHFLDMPSLPHTAEKQSNITPNVSRLELLFRNKSTFWLRGLFPPSLRASIRRGLLRLSGSAEYRLNDAQKNALRQELKEDMRQLSIEFNVDVSSWGY